MMTEYLSEVVDFMIFLAKKAGEILMENYGKPYKTEWEKQHIRTEIDKKVGMMVREEIAKAYPDFTIFSEELPDKKGGNMIFVIDEIDGTIPFFRRFSDHSAFSIGLYEGTQPRAGVVFAPKREELYVGSKKGAFCNGKPIQVSQTQDVNKVLMYIVSGKDKRDGHLSYLKRAFSENGIVDTPNCGSASLALCMVACGRLDAVLATSLEPEDMAGAVPILLAAGAKLKNMRDEEWQLGDRSIFVANPELFPKLSDFLGLGLG